MNSYTRAKPPLPRNWPLMYLRIAMSPLTFTNVSSIKLELSLLSFESLRLDIDIFCFLRGISTGKELWMGRGVLRGFSWDGVILWIVVRRSNSGMCIFGCGWFLYWGCFGIYLYEFKLKAGLSILVLFLLSVCAIINCKLITI